jgi:thioredoxin-like negative regulator of GroEL
VARRGLGAATGKRVSNASRVWRDAVEGAERSRPGGTGRPGEEARSAPAVPVDDERRRDDEARAARAARAEEQWVRVEEVRDEAEAAVVRGSSGRPGRGGSTATTDLAEEVRAELARAVGTARSERVERRLREAADDFENERFGDAARVLRKLSDEAPTVGAVRELYGLTLYRQGKWRAAAQELEAYRLLTDSVDQHPVLADCYRALRQWGVVEELWAELGSASPSAEIVTEGRIVAAGALADRAELVPAIRLLESGWRFPKAPKTFHLRRAYALADLYERAGEVPRARDLFGQIRAADPSFADVESRLRALR